MQKERSGGPSAAIAAAERGQLSTALALDVLDARGFRHQAVQCGIVPRTTTKVTVGRAKTLLWMDFAHSDPKTYILELEAVDSIAAGEMIICATGGSQRAGVWGELLTTAAQRCGATGVVTDGAVRDVALMEAMLFPVFSQHLSAYDSFNRQKVVAYDVRVEMGGVTIDPGDLIVADRDGVAVVPAAMEEEIVAAAVDKATREDGFRAGVRNGMSLVDAYARFKVL
ncbi:MAG TPA: RraA family protein [Bauldia sp.]|nr:RraA family protein [Bauldia sp.]HVZ15289.1 RraA family protein [Bauldia sp.]